MNTSDARHRLLDLTLQARDIVQKLAEGQRATGEDRATMRELIREAREAAYDAGFPGDAAWRALLRAGMTVTNPQEEPDQETWTEILEGLAEGQDRLSLVTGMAVEN